MHRCGIVMSSKYLEAIVSVFVNVWNCKMFAKMMI